jgi:hypothetical protein
MSDGMSERGKDESNGDDERELSAEQRADLERSKHEEEAIKQGLVDLVRFKKKARRIARDLGKQYEGLSDVDFLLLALASGAFEAGRFR